VAGDAAADVGGGDPCLAAEHGDDSGVDVVLGDAAGAVREQEVHAFSGLAVQYRGLPGTDGLPGFDRLAEQGVDGLGERGARLVDVQQADRLADPGLVGVSGDGHAVVLPSDAADPEPGKLVAALCGEQPGQRDGPDEFDRMGPAVRGRQVARLDVNLAVSVGVMRRRCSSAAGWAG